MSNHLGHGIGQSAARDAAAHRGGIFSPRDYFLSCAAGGVVDVTYQLMPNEAPARRGFVQANFQGCGTAQVFTITEAQTR